MIGEPKVSEARTIEIIGPPGIGKSKLYHEVCKTWSPEKNWTYHDVLLAPEKPSMLNFINWLEYNYRWYLGKKLSKSLPTDFGLKFIRQNEELAGFCWKYLTEDPVHNSLESRFRHAYFLYDNFCGYQAITEKRSPKPCLIEEGLFQKSFLIHDSKQLMEEILDEYLSVLPLPYAVIGLDTENIGLIVSRLRKRKKVIPSHQHKDDKDLIRETEKWQYFIRLVLDKLENKNVLVYRVDGSKPLGEKVTILTSILKSMTL